MGYPKTLYGVEVRSKDRDGNATTFRPLLYYIHRDIRIAKTGHKPGEIRYYIVLESGDLLARTETFTDAKTAIDNYLDGTDKPYLTAAQRREKAKGITRPR